MTQKEIVGNILIAKFMGVEVSMRGGKFKNYLPPFGYFKVHPQYMKYHTSWDWLMPVINKIRSLYNSAEIDICYYVEDIISNIAEGCVEANILQVYESVSEFIVHYNKIK